MADFDMREYNLGVSASHGPSPVSSSARSRLAEASKYRYSKEKEAYDRIRQQEYKEAYNELLSLYNQYSGREDDTAKIMKGYYLELLNDLNDEKKKDKVMERWASGMIQGVPQRRGKIGSKPLYGSGYVKGAESTIRDMLTSSHKYKFGTF